MSGNSVQGDCDLPSVFSISTGGFGNAYVSFHELFILLLSVKCRLTMNELMNFITYIPLVKPEAQTQGVYCPAVDGN